MKKLIISIVALSSMLVLADEVTQTARTQKRLTRQKLNEIMYKKNGPMLSVPGMKQGKIVYVNAQKRAPTKWLEDSAEVFRALTKIEIEVIDGVFAMPCPKVLGNASLFVVDEENLPPILLAPESKWCMVNIASLSKGEGAKDAFYAARVQKELARGFALLAGAQSSNSPQTIMGCVTKPEDLDQFANARLPVDVSSRFVSYVAGYGIKPDKKLSYRKACQEGWAPQPTNDIERAVWSDVHKLPDKPIKIEYDPKKGK